MEDILKNRRGYTLIELLIVIAIIAILVVIVIVALDPAQRVRDSLDRAAQSNVRAVGTLISVCVTQRLSQTPTLTFEGCSEDTIISSYGNRSSEVKVAAGNGPGDNDVCAAQQGSVGLFGHYYVYKNSTGKAEANDGELSNNPADWCP